MADQTRIYEEWLFAFPNGRAQKWFCERCDGQSTRPYPLSDFVVRKGTENIERGYLSARYGALPLVRELLMWQLNT